MYTTSMPARPHQVGVTHILKAIALLSQQLPFHPHFFFAHYTLAWWLVNVVSFRVALKFGKLPSRTLVTLSKTLNKKEIRSPKWLMWLLLFLFLSTVVFYIEILLLLYHNCLSHSVECSVTHILQLSHIVWVISTVKVMNLAPK